jgi:uncharacterized damage-inducible protein DinB
MTETVYILGKLFEHNNWANRRIIEVCSALTDEQLDAEPQTATKGNIRRTLVHLVSSQLGYLRTLTLPLDARPDSITVAFADLQASANASGERLLTLARNESSKFPQTQLHTRDGYLVEAWVLMVQIINHASEHREQICSMLSSLGITPPNLDGWGYGEAANALIPIAK